MGFTYNIAEDFLYQEGLATGLEKGKKDILIKMLTDKTLSIEKIAEFTDVTVEYVKLVAKELNK